MSQHLTNGDRIRDAGCRMQETEDGGQDAGCRMKDKASSTEKFNPTASKVILNAE
ncbi:MAG: hypothetical protein HY693_05200 [Deltaproteobacteria bacterium]|nr:hypothetical protein [Deltaproteobacteria bacterium]